VALLAAPLLFGCESPAAPLLVEGAQRFDPPPAYHLWWELTQECSGRRALFSRVRWYYVPGTVTLEVDGQRVEGYWTAPNTIVLAHAAVHDGPLVRHEMLHALQDADGHPREFFLERCGGVVMCEGRCLEDAGPPPPANAAAPRVDPSALEVGVELRPRGPSLGLYGGHFTLVVTARNPRSDAVIATLPPTSFGEPSTSFEYLIENLVGLGGAVRAWDAGVTRFAPGETKRQAFDLYLAGAVGIGDGGLPPGTYRFFGAYGGHWSAVPATLTVP